MKIVLTGVTKRVPRRLAGSILDNFLNTVQQFGIINGLSEGEQERTRKEQGGRGKQRKRSEEAELHHATNLIDVALEDTEEQ